MDWKTISNYVLLVGLFLTMVIMFNQVNGRLTPCRLKTSVNTMPCRRCCASSRDGLSAAAARRRAAKLPTGTPLNG